MHASNPVWASGAAPERSFGPFLNRDGRNFWFDFFRIEKLVALYVQGFDDPALLFKIRTGFQFIGFRVSTRGGRSEATYRLHAGSIWINSRLLAANAPPGFFTGLTIRGGSVVLGAEPATVGVGRLTIAPGTTVRVQLRVGAAGGERCRIRHRCGRAGRTRRGASSCRRNPPFTLAAAGTRSMRIGLHRLERLRAGGPISRGSRDRRVSYDALLNRVLIPLACSAGRTLP